MKIDEFIKEAIEEQEEREFVSMLIKRVLLLGVLVLVASTQWK